MAPSATPRGSASARSCCLRSPSERGGVGERVAAAGAHLHLGGDQLADEMRLELRSLRGFLELLEAVDEVERLRVEKRELLLDCDREIGHGLELRAETREHLLVAEPLLLAHAKKPTYAFAARGTSGNWWSSVRTCGSSARAGPTGSQSVKAR